MWSTPSRIQCTRVGCTVLWLVSGHCRCRMIPPCVCPCFAHIMQGSSCCAGNGCGGYPRISYHPAGCPFNVRLTSAPLAERQAFCFCGHRLLSPLFLIKVITLLLSESFQRTFALVHVQIIVYLRNLFCGIHIRLLFHRTSTRTAALRELEAFSMRLHYEHEHERWGLCADNIMVMMVKEGENSFYGG